MYGTGTVACGTEFPGHRNTQSHDTGGKVCYTRYIRKRLGVLQIWKLIARERLLSEMNNKVATAQRIWMFTFWTGKTQIICLNILKIVFLHREIASNTDGFEDFKISRF